MAAANKPGDSADRLSGQMLHSAHARPNKTKTINTANVNPSSGPCGHALRRHHNGPHPGPKWP
eukprot:7248528-Lingulodinium_polyedra.AAC.1